MGMKDKRVTRNKVAKHAYKTNKAVVFQDRTKYTRKSKHKTQEYT